MDSKNCYRTGPRLYYELPSWGWKEYQQRFGVGPICFAVMVALASHEEATGDGDVRVGEVANFLGLNVHPSLKFLVNKGWIEKRGVESSRRSPRTGLVGWVYYIKLTPLGWEYITEFLGIERHKEQ